MNKNTLKNIGKVYTCITLVSSVTCGLGYLKLKYNEKKAKGKAIKVWDSIKHEVVEDLGLSQVPTIKFDNNSDSIMHVTQTIEYRNIGILTREIINQSTDYVIHVNALSVANSITMLNVYTLRDLSTEIIKALFRHECRHLYQFQSGFDIGKHDDVLKMNMSFINGYGSDEKETDANLYAIKVANGTKEKLVAEYNKAMQDNAEKILTDYSEAQKAIKKLHRFNLF